MCFYKPNTSKSSLSDSISHSRLSHPENFRPVKNRRTKNWICPHSIPFTKNFRTLRTHKLFMFIVGEGFDVTNTIDWGNNWPFNKDSISFSISESCDSLFFRFKFSEFRTSSKPSRIMRSDEPNWLSALSNVEAFIREATDCFGKSSFRRKRVKLPRTWLRGT